MDRRHFLALSGISLAAACTKGSSKVESAREPGKKIGPLAEGRFFQPVIQQGPLGQKVIHDRLTYIEQYKYDNWKPEQAAKGWKDDAELWKDFSWQWGNGKIPIQKRPMQVLEGLFVLGPADYQQNIYLWDTGNGLLLVDPSYELFRPVIETQIRQLGYDLTDVKWLLLTHGHSDHAQSAEAYMGRGADIYIQADEAGIKEVKASSPPEVARKIKTFVDNEALSFGSLKMTAIHTPGHTSGSACFSLDWKGTGMLISGDVVSHFGRHTSIDEGGDWNQYLACLWKLYNHPEAKTWQVVLPGHSTIDLDRGKESIYKVLQVTSDIIRRRRAGENIDWIDPYEFFWKLKINGQAEPEPLLS